MIGSYRGSSGAERALRQVLEAMVMPAGVDLKLDWPAFRERREGSSLRMAYRRADTDYETGQSHRLLEVEGIPFELYIWSSNENEVLAVMDHLENGFNVFPLRDAMQAMRAFLGKMDGESFPAAPEKAGPIATRVSTLLASGWVDEQEENLAQVNQNLAELTRLARPANWSAVLATLRAVQSRMTAAPPYSFKPLGCRDLTAPEIWQLGLAGRVFIVAVEFTAAT